MNEVHRVIASETPVAFSQRPLAAAVSPRGLWGRPGGSNDLPGTRPDVLTGPAQMGPAGGGGKVRVTRWVKLDPSWRWLRLRRRAAGIISIKAHAGSTRDYNGV